MRGTDELKELFSWLSEDIPTETMNRLTVRNEKIIEMASLKVKKSAQISKWKKNLKERQIEKILNVVSKFGLDFYTEQLEPDYHKLENFPKKSL